MVSKNTLTTNVWDEVYAVLQTGAFAITTNNIFSAWNSTLANDKGYPLVILDPPSANLNKLSANGAFIQSRAVVNCRVYHTSSQNVKAVRDEIVSKLLAARKFLAGKRLLRLNIEDGDYDVWSEGNKRIHRLSFGIIFFYAESET
jgi:hypothetical protein